MNLSLNQRVHEVRWSKGSCGVAGCRDPECVWALCAKPIGIPESDPRWNDHDPECFGCPICADSVPITLFRGEGKACEQATFHDVCFNKLLEQP